MRRLLALLLFVATPCAAQNTLIGEAGGNHTMVAGYVGEAGGNHNVLNGYIGTAAGNKVFFSALSVVASPTSVSGSRPTAGPVTTGSTTATASGGIGPFTYAWTDTGNATITSPSSATTTFSAFVSCSNAPVLDTATVTATDTGTGLTKSTTVAVTLSFTGTPC
jgi:hypothetical protein